jgi:hypothetical protein
MLYHADILQMEKHSTLPFRALNSETRLEQFQLVGPLSGNSQNILILATQTPAIRKWESRRLFHRRPDNRRTSPTPKSGHAI